MNRTLKLSRRQRAILRRIAMSWTLKQISWRYRITVKGVYYHIGEIQRKLRIYGKAALTRYALIRFP